MKKNSYIYKLLTNVMDFIRGQEPMDAMNTGINRSIEAWLDSMNITECNISENLSINSYHKIDISEKQLTGIPPFIKFSEITGGFYCSNNQLKNLIGTPSHIHNGSFICADNDLESLIGGPSFVDGWYVVSHNKLTSLDGIAQEINGTLAIDNNLLTSLKGCPKVIKGDFFCQRNPLKNLDYFPEKITGVLHINYLEEFKNKDPRLFIEEIYKRCSVEEIKII